MRGWMLRGRKVFFSGIKSVGAPWNLFRNSFGIVTQEITHAVVYLGFSVGR